MMSIFRGSPNRPWDLLLIWCLFLIFFNGSFFQGFKNNPGIDRGQKFNGPGQKELSRFDPFLQGLSHFPGFQIAGEASGWNLLSLDRNPAALELLIIRLTEASGITLRIGIAIVHHLSQYLLIPNRSIP